MSNADASEELLSIANLAYFQCRGNDVEKLRAALNAIAPRLKAEGMREAAEITSAHIEKAMKDGVDAFVAVLLRNAILARADALDPPKETK